MVMLDLLARGDDVKKEILVAHFDHGIRENSAEDAEFIRRKAAEYGVEFRSERAELGPEASEALAREKRYDFLQRMAAEWGEAGRPAIIYTAHHLDDLVESVAINLLRGTGWRGLAVLDRPEVRRPLLETEVIYEPMDKAAILEYAARQGLTWREDPSNSWDEYLRNRLRHQMHKNPLDFEQKLTIYKLWQQQCERKKEIERQLIELVPSEGGAWPREWFRELDRSAEDRAVALELLKFGTERAGVAATRPQLESFRKAILEYAPGKSFNLPGDVLVKLKKDDFRL